MADKSDDSNCKSAIERALPYDLSIPENAIASGIDSCALKVNALCFARNIDPHQVAAVARASEAACDRLYERWGRTYSDSHDEYTECEEARLAPLKQFVTSHPQISVEALQAIIDVMTLTEDAQASLQSGNLGQSIFHLRFACNYAGAASVLVHGDAAALRDAESAAKSALGRKGAESRHAENRAMKAQALDYFAEHRHEFKNLDDAAMAIIKIVAVEFSTAREWLKGHGRINKPRR